MNPRGLIPCNDKGYRIGEAHHNCTRSDAIVQRARELHESTEHLHPCSSSRLGPTRIAKILGVPVEWVRKIIYFTSRGQVPRQWRRNCSTRTREENEAHGQQAMIEAQWKKGDADG